MNWVSNIAKALTNKLGRLLTSPPAGGGWGVFLLLALPCFAYSQNSAEEPYLNSRHKYQVTMGDVTNNTYRWNIYDDLTNANNDLAENASPPPYSYLLDDESWIFNNQKNATGAEIEIFFDENIFSDGSSWYLVFSEISAATGACVARRRFDITIRDNNFYFTLPADGSQCNSLEGEVLTGDDISGKLASTVDFTISMNKAADHLVDRWSLTGQISFSGAASYLAGDVTFQAAGTSDTENEAWVITDNGGGNFTLELDCIPDDANYTSDAVSFTVNILGYVYETVDVSLTLSNGEASSGTDYEIITDDNLNKASGDRSQTITIDGLPPTDNIAFSE